MVRIDRIHPRPRQGALCLWGEPQWGVVGDTFPVGCAYSKNIVFPRYFAANPYINNPLYQTKYGIYEPNCGLENMHLSFGPMATSAR
jgi:inositol oxygenase